MLDGKQDKISVVVPVYNAEPYVKECIDSILNQDHRNLEVIAVDDGSSDNSLNILQQISEQDSRLHVFSRENRGVSVARNFGLSKITGDFVCFVDSDDRITNDYLRSLLEKIDHADAVFSNFSFLYEDGSVVPKPARLNKGEYPVEELLPKLIDDGTLTGILFGSSCMALYRSERIRQHHLCFHESVRKNEDGLFNIEYLLHADRICVLNHNGYHYRHWKNGKTDIAFSLEEFEKVNAFLTQYADRFENFEQQLARRRISSVFWESCKILGTKEPIMPVYKKLKSFCKENFKPSDYVFLDFGAMSRSKKILIRLLSRKRYFLFVFFMKTLVPFFYRKVQH